MHAKSKALLALISFGSLLVSGCAALKGQEPVEVLLVGADPIAGEGLEVRMMIKLRVQNPNETSIEYSGVYAKLDVQGKTFASGVSSVSGSVPRFGESIVEVPVSTSAFRIARQVMSMTGGTTDKLAYELSGKLSGAKGVPFKTKGEFSFPMGGAESATK